jgi:hypothetical protein
MATAIFGSASSPAFIANWVKSFKEFPPRRKPASFSGD